MKSKTKILKCAAIIEKNKPASIESKLIIKSVKGNLYMERYSVKIDEMGTRIITDAQKGIGSIAIKGFAFIGSLN